MSEEKDRKFFYKDKFFQDEEEFFNYVNKWPSCQTDNITFEREWKELGKNILINLEIYRKEMTNAEMNSVFEEGFVFFINRFLGRGRM